MQVNAAAFGGSHVYVAVLLGLVPIFQHWINRISEITIDPPQEQKRQKKSRETLAESTIRRIDLDRGDVVGDEHEEEAADREGDPEDDQGPPERHCRSSQRSSRATQYTESKP